MLNHLHRVPPRRRRPPLWTPAALPPNAQSPSSCPAATTPTSTLDTSCFASKCSITFIVSRRDDADLHFGHQLLCLQMLNHLHRVPPRRRRPPLWTPAAALDDVRRVIGLTANGLHSARRSKQTQQLCP